MDKRIGLEDFSTCEQIFGAAWENPSKRQILTFSTLHIFETPFFVCEPSVWFCFCVYINMKLQNFEKGEEPAFSFSLAVFYEVTHCNIPEDFPAHLTY